MMTPSAGPPPAITVSLGGLLLLFVASRLLYLVLIDPGSPLIHPNDELYRGTIAQELLTGLSMPFTDYRADNHSGGHLVIGALAAGFFLLFGPTLFALKLAPLFLFTLALVFWYWTIQRHAGERVAGYFALLFCFSPPLVTDFSVMAMGFHSESIAFSALTVFLFFRMLSVGAGGARGPVALSNATGGGSPPALAETPSPAYPVLLGLTAGVGLWFAYIYGLTLLALLGFWFWHEKGMLWRPRFAWFALGFVVGFAPWIIMNLQTHFAGLVVHGTNVWEHFGLAYLLDDLAHPRDLAPIAFLRTIASVDDWDLYRRAVNLFYSLLYLGPILTVGVLRWKTVRSAPAGPSPTRLTLVGFAVLYLAMFALAVQFSDFRVQRYYLPAYPFLFFLTAYALARCQDLLPHVQRQVQTVFLASAVVLGLGTHAPLVSLDRPGVTLSAKGYSYARMPEVYVDTHAPAGFDDRGFLLKGDRDLLLEVVQRPFLSSILPKLSSDDQWELSRAIALLLAEAVPLNGQAEDFARLERVVPPGFDRHFYYWLGMRVMARYPNELPKAVAAVDFLRHRSAAAHHLVLIGVYRFWPQTAGLNISPEALLTAPAVVAPALAPHYWRALGYWAGRYWYNNERSLSLLHAHLQAFVPRLNPTVQRAFLQGVGELLFDFTYTRSVAPAELERFPLASQEALLEGWGMALGEAELPYPYYSTGHEILSWMPATKGFSARSLVSVRRGKAQFEALFEGAALSAPGPPRQAP